MSIANRNVKRGAGILESKLDLGQRYTQEYFRVNPVAAKKGGAAAGGATGDVNIMGLGRNIFEYHIKGAGQTIIVPVQTDEGLDISLDQTSTEGIEISQGILNRAPGAFKIGTDAPFFIRAKIKVEDASGASPLLLGFRKQEAYNADRNAYADYAFLGIVGTAGDIKIETEIAGGGTTTTDTTNDWADAETHTLQVSVGKNGNVSYLIDNVVPKALPASVYAFADALKVIPCLFFLHGADLAGEVELIEWECGIL